LVGLPIGKAGRKSFVRKRRAVLLNTIERFEKAEASAEFSLWKLRADEAQWIMPARFWLGPD
jgi:hypothetical protein